MDELKVLRDVTLFYNEHHPELRAAAKKPAAEDAVDAKETGDVEGNRTSNPEMQKTPAKSPARSPSKSPVKSPERSPHTTPKTTENKKTE